MSQVKIPMTQKQILVYNFIKNYLQQNGLMPMQSEIQEHFGLKSLSTIQFHLKALEERGWIPRLPNRQRAIALSDSLHSSN